MTIRTNKDTRIEQVMSGVRQLGDKFEDVIEEIHGMTDVPDAASLFRLPGKLLNSTATTSTVWSIHQLRFRNRNAICVKIDNGITQDSDHGNLPGMEFDLPRFPRMIGEDWPETNTEAQRLADETFHRTGVGLLPGGYKRQSQRGPAYIVADPTTLAFDCPDWDDGLVVEITKIWDVSASWGGFCPVRFSWDPSATWLTATRSGRTNVPGISEVDNGEVVPLGFWSDPDSWPYYIGFRIDKNSLPAGANVVVVTLTATDWFNNPLINPDGSEVTETITITATRMTFTVTVPGTITRGKPFDLVIQSSNAAYVPSGNVNISISADALDDIYPSVTDNTGWVGGAKTVSCVVSGGAGSDAFTITVEDPVCLVEGTASGTVSGATLICNSCVPCLNPDYDLVLSGLPGGFAFMNGSHTLPNIAGCTWRTSPPGGTLTLQYNVGPPAYWELHVSAGATPASQLYSDDQTKVACNPKGTYTNFLNGLGAPIAGQGVVTDG